MASNGEQPDEQTTEQALRESEERYRTLADLSPEATIVNVKGRVVYANRAAARLLGAERTTELLGLPTLDLVEPEFHDLVRSRSREVAGGATLRAIEYRWRRLDGTPVDVEVSASGINWDGRPAVQVVARDISERKRIETELRESAALLEQQHRRTVGILESISDAFYAVDRDYRFTYINWKAEELWGRSREDLIGKILWQEFPQAVDSKAYQMHLQAMEQRKSVHFEAVSPVLRQWIDVSLYPEAGGGLSCYFRDISEQKRAQQEIQSLNARLESLVNERTRQLTQAIEELDSFNYSVSHDLRAPLRAVDGFAYALLADYGESLDATAHSYLDRVRAGAHRMGQLIDDLLRLSRLSRSRLDRKPVNLSDIAQEICTALHDRERHRQVDVEVEPELRAQGDSGLLRVALENLLENAWKFTRGVDQARITVGREEQGGESIFFIRDNGAGFDQRYSDKLFAPFGRLHAPERFEGTGVGLAMVQRVIHLHGGRVWGEGKVDEGATFFFTLAASGDSLQPAPPDGPERSYPPPAAD